MEVDEERKVERPRPEATEGSRTIAQQARIAKVLPDILPDLVRVSRGEGITPLVLALGRDGLTRVAVVRTANAWRDQAEVGFRRFEEVLERRSGDDVATMMLAITIGRKMMAAQDPVHRRVWGHLLRVGLIGHHIAPLDPQFTRFQAVLMGALHDIGILGLLHAGPERYRDLVRLAGGTLVGLDNLERARLGVFHPDVAVAMLEPHNAPTHIVVGVAGHHNDPPRPPECSLLDVMEALDLNASVGMSPEDAAQAVADSGLVHPEEVDWLATALESALSFAGSVARVVALENA